LKALHTCSRKDFEVKYYVAMHSIVYNAFCISCPVYANPNNKVIGNCYEAQIR